jgi:hypothetical protein
MIAHTVGDEPKLINARVDLVQKNSKPMPLNAIMNLYPEAEASPHVHILIDPLTIKLLHSQHVSLPSLTGTHGCMDRVVCPRARRKVSGAQLFKNMFLKCVM